MIKKEERSDFASILHRQLCICEGESRFDLVRKKHPSSFPLYLWYLLLFDIDFFQLWVL